MTAQKPILALVLALLGATACGDDDDDGASQAQRLGVGAACDTADDCPPELMLQCLSFKGGYCGLQDCTGDIDCPAGSACVAHDDGMNYCFLICTDKVQCNYGRPLDAESNCSSNITFVEDQGGGIKACVPPTG
jgi:hypothetical protein